MASLLRNAMKAVREKGIGGFPRDLREEGYMKCLLDGILLQTKIHSIGTTLFGADKFGNKYYEQLENTQFGLKEDTGAWVEYGDKARYNASQVRPEWHGWLHYITDHTGDEEPLFVNVCPFNGEIVNRKVGDCTQLRTYFQNTAQISSRISISPSLTILQQPPIPPNWRYGNEHKENFSGEGDKYMIYHSKGHTLNPGQRDWTAYQPWQPTKTSEHPFTTLNDLILLAYVGFTCIFLLHIFVDIESHKSRVYRF